MSDRQWSGKSDGTPFMQWSLVAMMRHIDVRVFYGIMAVVILFYIVFGHRHSRHIYRYMRSCHHMRPLRALAMTYMTYFRFGQVIMDRYAVYAGRKFNMLFDDDSVRNLLDNTGDGVVVLASHIGNYEMAGYLLCGKGRPMNVLLYAGEQRLITEKRIRFFARNNINTIMVDDNMNHLFAINKALQAGEIVSFHADRLVNSQKSISLPIFGRNALLPFGPFLIAASAGKPVVTLFVMKTRWNSYRIFGSQLLPPPDSDLRSAASSLASQYAHQLEHLTTLYPTQWFQFYNFWN